MIWFRVLVLATAATASAEEFDFVFNLTAPAGASANATISSLIVRAYERFDGSEYGWATVPYAPSVGLSLDGDFETCLLILGYDGTGQGSILEGTDQFAHYFAPMGECSDDPSIVCHSDFNCETGSCLSLLTGATTAVLAGRFDQAAYYSINVGWTWTDGSTLAQYSCDADWSMADTGAPHPYHAGDPSVFVATIAPNVAPALSTRAAAGKEEEEERVTTRTTTAAAPAADAAAVPLYRPDQESSGSGGFDGVPPPDGCSDTYLSSALFPSHQCDDDATTGGGIANFSFLVLRAKVRDGREVRKVWEVRKVSPRSAMTRAGKCNNPLPARVFATCAAHTSPLSSSLSQLPRVFVRGEAAPPDAVFAGDYDVRYWSVGSHVCGTYGNDDGELPWWTANVRMLNATKVGAGGQGVRPMASEMDRAEPLRQRSRGAPPVRSRRRGTTPHADSFHVLATADAAPAPTRTAAWRRRVRLRGRGGGRHRTATATGTSSSCRTPLRALSSASRGARAGTRRR